MVLVDREFLGPASAPLSLIPWLERYREEHLVVSPGPTHPHLVGPSGTHDSPYSNMDQ